MGVEVGRSWNGKHRALHETLKTACLLHVIAMIFSMPFSRYCGWSNEITGIQVLGKLCSLHIDLTVLFILLMRLKEVNGGSDSC